MECRLDWWLQILAPLVLGAVAGLVSGALIAYATLRGYVGRQALKPALEPSGRARRRGRRYIVFEVLGTEPVGFEELRGAIEDTVRRVYGELGAVMFNVKLIEYDGVRRRGVLRVRRDFKLQALAVLGLVRSSNGRRLLLIPISTTGSLRRARAIVRG
jgi:ribonuclease P/MRP protein subunit POP5